MKKEGKNYDKTEIYSNSLIAYKYFFLKVRVFYTKHGQIKTRLTFKKLGILIKMHESTYSLLQQITQINSYIPSIFILASLKGLQDQTYFLLSSFIFRLYDRH